MNRVRVRGREPSVASDAYVDPRATLMGDVRVATGVGIWPGVVIRADEAPVILEKETMVLENAVIEASSGEVIIGDRSIVSHGAIIHGGRVGEKCLIGIGAIVLDEAVIMDHVIIGSAALVPPGKRMEGGNLVLGVPGRVIRPLTSEEEKNREKEWYLLAEKVPLYREIRMSPDEGNESEDPSRP